MHQPNVFQVDVRANEAQGERGQSPEASRRGEKGKNTFKEIKRRKERQEKIEGNSKKREGNRKR